MSDEKKMPTEKETKTLSEKWPDLAKAKRLRRQRGRETCLMAVGKVSFKPKWGKPCRDGWTERKWKESNKGKDALPLGLARGLGWLTRKKNNLTLLKRRNERENSSMRKKRWGVSSIGYDLWKEKKRSLSKKKGRKIRSEWNKADRFEQGKTLEPNIYKSVSLSQQHEKKIGGGGMLGEKKNFL